MRGAPLTVRPKNLSDLHARYQRLPSRHLDRHVHLWSYGWHGHPVLVFPSAAGMAHEWQSSGAVEALAPLLRAGRIKLYCPESNVSEAWTGEGDPRWRLNRHRAYEAFLLDELMPHIDRDCRTDFTRVSTVGCSFGAFYAVNTALKYPHRVDWALGLSGRYDTHTFLHGHSSDDAYFNQPLAYVPGLRGPALWQVQQTSFTLVVGQGAYEGRCIQETVRMARTLEERGIPVHLDAWGHDVSHEWVWWTRQLRYHFGRRFG